MLYVKTLIKTSRIGHKYFKRWADVQNIPVKQMLTVLFMCDNYIVQGKKHKAFSNQRYLRLVLMDFVYLFTNYKQDDRLKNIMKFASLVCQTFLRKSVIFHWTEGMQKATIFFSSLSAKIMNFWQIYQKMILNQVSNFCDSPFQNSLAYMQSVLKGCQFSTKNALTTFKDTFQSKPTITIILNAAINFVLDNL